MAGSGSATAGCELTWSNMTNRGRWKAREKAIKVEARKK
jgi:hypothetical protein